MTAERRGDGQASRGCLEPAAMAVVLDRTVGFRVVGVGGFPRRSATCQRCHQPWRGPDDLLEAPQQRLEAAALLQHDLPGCHSQCETRDEALPNIREAIGLWLEVEAEEAGVSQETVRVFQKLGYRVVTESGYRILSNSEGHKAAATPDVAVVQLLFHQSAMPD